MAKMPGTGLARRVGEAMRAYWSGPITSNSPEIARLWQTQPVSSGVAVTEVTALRNSAFFSAVNLISSDVAALPLLVYKRLQDGGKERMTGSPLYKLLHDRPNPEMTSFVWRKTMQAHCLSWGNGYSEIERNAGGRPIALWPLTPDRVCPFRRSYDSPLQYLVSNRENNDVILDAADMLHVPGLGFDGTRGYSVIGHMRESIGLGLAAEQFGGTFYGNSASMSGVITYPGDPSDLVKKNNRDTLAARHQGVQNAHKMLALYGGATYNRIGIPPNEAQFLETRQFQVNEIARWFNIPPHKLAELSRSTNNNIEQQTIDYYTTTLIPWLTAWEQELCAKLIPQLEQNQQFVEHLVDGLLRGDIKTRSDAYGAQFLVGGLTPNDVRRAENRNLISGGDRTFVPLNMMPLDRVDEWIDAQIEAKKAPKPAPLAPKPEPDPAQAKRIEELEHEVALARRTCQEAEDAKDIANNGLLEARAALAAATGDAEKEQARLAAQATSLGADLGKATADLSEAVRMNGVIEADYQRVCREKTESEQARDAAIAQAQASAEALQKRSDVCDRDILAVQDERIQAVARAVAAEAAVTEAEQRIAVSEAVLTELRAQVVTTTADVEARQAALAAAQGALARTEAERDEHRTQREEAIATLATADAAVRGVKDALRLALAYSVDCIIRREADRARKAQASPEKLLRHLENFYQTHGEFCREALRPIVRAVAVLDGSDANALLDRVVPDLIETSTVQLRLVASDTDPETLAPALERVLRRWEAERGEAVADRLMRGTL